MMAITDKKDPTIEQLIAVAEAASDAILEIYEGADFGIEYKDDESPLTRADRRSNDVIVERLKAISNAPIISEENELRDATGDFWLVDPLDGTKEFIKRNGEFTVNIALVRDGRPVLGVVYVPVSGVVYAGSVLEGSLKIENGQKRLLEAVFDGKIPVIVTSRSHKGKETEEFLENIGKFEEVSVGSSLKICLVAEGTAMLYPRMGPTWLWDSAAADAVLTYAGGKVTDLHGKILQYKPDRNMKNPFFMAASSNSIEWLSHIPS